MLRPLAHLTIGLFLLTTIPLSAEDSDSIDSKAPAKPAKNGRPEATHKQARVISPKHNGEKISLNTYCLAPTGELLVCVGGPSVEYVSKPDQPGQYDIKRIESAAFVQKYSPEGDLLKEIQVDFKPTGINFIPGGKEFVVAGEGWLARMKLDGTLVKKGRTPNVGDYEKFKEQAVEAAKTQLQEYVGQFESQLKAAEKKLAKLEETEEADRSKSVKAQIEAQKQIADQARQQIEQYEQMFGFKDPDAAVRDKLTITAVAATDKDLFVSIKKLKGHGYDVWRTNHDFEEGEKVVEDLGGCCGQLDIQASAEHLLIAENGKFRVGIYDRDGEMTKSFGKRDRKSAEGFGSCCNPMNVRCCSNGEILTAESSIGDIKRFSADGKYLGYIGRAKIGGGCKHVAIEFDSARNRYYMQHQDKGQICVLVPASEVTGPTEDELLEKAAREGLGTKLIGSWSLPEPKKRKKSRAGLLSSVVGLLGQDQQLPASSLTFDDDGVAKFSGGMLASYSSEGQVEWRAIRQDGNQLQVGLVFDGVETFNLNVTFESDDNLKIELRIEENVMATGTYQRKVIKPKAVDEAEKPSAGDESEK